MFTSPDQVEDRDYIKGVKRLIGLAVVIVVGVAAIYFIVAPFLTPVTSAGGGL